MEDLLARSLRAWLGGHRWLCSLLVLAICCAATTAYCLVNYPTFAAGDRGPPFYASWSLALALLATGAPIVWLCAIATPKTALLQVLQAHAALYSVFLVITDFADSPGHSSPAEAFVPAIWLILMLVLAVDAVVAAVTAIRVKRRSRSAKATPFVYIGLTIALLGGWFTGVLIWSAMLPRRVIMAAEAAAGESPYCIELEKGPARSARDLRGLNMRATNDRGWTWNFHALLVVGEPAARRYMNWSYKSGRFEPVSDDAREGLRLDQEPLCRLTAHFALGWLS
jgi:hypothetical protein